MTTIDYNSIGQRAYATAKEKGWYSDGGPDFGTRIALIHSEVSEALEAYRKDHWSAKIAAKESLSMDDERFADYFTPWIKGTVGDELADVVIRCCESLAHFGVDSNELRASMHLTSELLPPSFPACLALLHRKISWIGIGSDDSENNGHIKRAAMHTEAIAAKFNIDLASHIEAKLRYNTTRPHRHGGKKC